MQHMPLIHIHIHIHIHVYKVLIALLSTYWLAQIPIVLGAQIDRPSSYQQSNLGITG
jgi:hypothetical protein